MIFTVAMFLDHNLQGHNLGFVYKLCNHFWGSHCPKSQARSIDLTVTAVMTGGTQLVQGAYLTGGGDTRFCRESSKSLRFWGEILNHQEINMED